MTRSARLSAAFAVGGLLVLGAAQAWGVTPSPWRSPEPISSPAGGVRTPDVAVNATGSAIAAWSQPVGAGRSVVQAAVRPFGGGWAAPQTLSAESGDPYLDPDVAIDIDGNAVVAWSEPRSATEAAVVVRIRPFATGAWLPSQTLSGPGVLADGPTAVIGPSGSIVAAWLERPAGGPVAPGRIQASVREASSGTWSTPAPLGPPAAAGVGLESDGAGTTLALAVVDPFPAPTFQTSIRPPGGPFGAFQALPRPGPLSLDIAISSGGQQVAAGPELPAVDDSTAVLFAARTGEGPWSAFSRISGRAVDPVDRVRVALDADANATILWQRAVGRRNSDGNVATTVAAEGPAAGPLGAPVQLSPVDQNAFPLGLGVNAAGTAAAIWVRVTARGSGLSGLVRLRPGSGWLAPEQIVPIGTELRTFSAAEDLAVTGDGVAVASFLFGGRLVAADRAAGRPGTIALTARQLLINQRIDQAAIRRAGALEDALAAGLTSANLRPGALLPESFDASVSTQGSDNGTILPAGPGVTIPVPSARNRQGDAVRLTQDQLLVNQRIAQAAVRRANALVSRLEAGLGGDDFRDGGIGAASLAPGVSIASTTSGTAPASPSPPVGTTKPGSGNRSSGDVTLSESQLVINQRVSQAAIVRLNSVRAILEGGVSGAEIRAGGIGASKLATPLR